MRCASLARPGRTHDAALDHRDDIQQQRRAERLVERIPAIPKRLEPVLHTIGVLGWIIARNEAVRQRNRELADHLDVTAMSIALPVAILVL
ncbi:MAG TPA: hypothetical protein VH165_15440 [Kofleriaceae bacterium]|jgi:hypothetical protein|nr:hypothetical protein [Kofleriaceae bacterium]